MFLEGHYFTHPIYDPLWAELEKLGTTCAVHPAVGMWNPEWTSHGPFFEKIKTGCIIVRSRPRKEVDLLRVADRI